MGSARLARLAQDELDAALPELILRLGRFAAITLIDTVLVGPSIGATGARWHELLFHELVHVAQFRALGTDGFAREYLRGWLAGGRRYERIPLEIEAYTLARRFAAGERFAVAHELRPVSGR
ncbi:MAG: hypothetical protein AB7R55_24030 [Gemmatimonadales bacterium]